MDKLSSRTSCLPSFLFTVYSKLDQLFSFPPIFLEIVHLDSYHCLSTADVKAAFSSNFNPGLNPRQCIRHLPPIVSFRRSAAHFPLRHKNGICTW